MWSWNLAPPPQLWPPGSLYLTSESNRTRPSLFPKPASLELEGSGSHLLECPPAALDSSQLSLVWHDFCLRQRLVLPSWNLGNPHCFSEGKSESLSQCISQGPTGKFEQGKFNIKKQQQGIGVTGNYVKVGGRKKTPKDKGCWGRVLKKGTAWRKRILPKAGIQIPLRRVQLKHTRWCGKFHWVVLNQKASPAVS